MSPSQANEQSLSDLPAVGRPTTTPHQNKSIAEENTQEWQKWLDERVHNMRGAIRTGLVFKGYFKNMLKGIKPFLPFLCVFISNAFV